ncbi:MAG: GNAT family N-acetyltransferase [Methanomicrobiaceae archaeon]|nr:GNAT family N-acetyltransferase [Methanomicrobiaceae archaeon]
MTYSIEALSEKNAFLWEEFNRQSREGTLFHSMQWKELLEHALDLKLTYYLILEDREVMGIWPFITRSVRYFRGLDAIPHSECNNIILDDSFDINRINDVLALFSKECSFLRFTSYNRDVLDRIACDNFSDAYTGNMMVDLNTTPPDAIWENLSKKTRKHLHRLENNGFEVRETRAPADIEMFYRYYAENTMYLKGDILPFSFFQNLMEMFPAKDVRIAVSTSGGDFAGGTLTIADRDKKTAYFEYMALNRKLPGGYTPTYMVYWDLINWAWDNGYEKISFGRQRLDPGNPRFRNKAKFGAEHVPIHSKFVLLSKPLRFPYRLWRFIKEPR